MFVSRDKKEALLFVFCNNSNYWCESVPRYVEYTDRCCLNQEIIVRLYLHGLIDSAYYEICELLPISRSHAHGKIKCKYSYQTCFIIFHCGMIRLRSQCYQWRRSHENGFEA